jgi:serine/threonine-protein kinase
MRNGASMPVEAARQIGVVLGGAYELVGCIGQGGMGVVYEAHHLRLKKRLAVKLLNRAHASQPETLKRFHREANLASRLGHPNLVSIIDFGRSEEGQPYLVMEYLEGEDLEHRLRRTGTVPLNSTVHIMRQVASALTAVHSRGIVHRDLKPANIFLVQLPGEADFVKVLDFGVSKIKAARTKLTNASEAVGTPQYMSPEQVSGHGEDVDHRTDQWALACIVWEMLSGHAPFSADDINALFYQLRNLPPPPLAEKVPDLAPAVETVLLRSLSKRPADRYPSIRDFARALETAAVGSCTKNTPVVTDLRELVTPSALTRVRAFVSRIAAALGFSSERRAGFTADHIGARPRARRAMVALAVLAVAVIALVTGLLLSGGRNRATAGRPPTISAPSTPPVTSGVRPAQPDGCCSSAEVVVTDTAAKRQSKPNVVRPKPGARRLAGHSAASAPKRSKTRSNSDDGVAGRRTERLRVEDF